MQLIMAHIALDDVLDVYSMLAALLARSEQVSQGVT